MSVHFDIEASSARLREALARVVIDEGTSAASRTKYRNPEAIIAVQAMVLKELNEATKPSVIIAAVMELTCDMIMGLYAGRIDQLQRDSAALIREFECQLFMVATGFGVQKGERVSPISEPGGHA